MQNNTQQVFEELFQDTTNTTCFECGIQATNWASVNNGVFLCLNCSGLHRGFGVNVSFVRSINMDSWSDSQLAMMKNGGNAKLRAFFDSYKIPSDGPIDFKYSTRAGAYYREMLKAISEGREAPNPPSVEEGLELLSNKNPNFNPTNNIVGMGSTENDSNNASFRDKLSLENVKSGVFTLGSSMYSGARNIATKVNEKVHDPNLKEEVKGLGSKVVTGTVETAGKIATGTKETAGKLAVGAGEVAGKLATGTKEAAGKMAEKSKEIWTHRDEYLQKSTQVAKQGFNSAFGFFKKLTGGKTEPANNDNNDGSSMNTEILDTTGNSSPQ